MAKDKKTSAKVFAGIMTCAMALMLALAIAISTVPVKMFDAVLRDYFGEMESKDPSENTEIIADTNYVTSKYASFEEVYADEVKFVREAAADGYVLLENNAAGGKGLPVKTSAQSKAKISFFSHSSVDLIIGGTGSGTSSSKLNLKTAFEASNYEVNDTLWQYYAKVKGHDRGKGAVAFGTKEDWSLKEVPLSKLSDAGVLSSADGTTPVFIMSRTGGEGRDIGRNMANYTEIAEDKNKSYLEPDSVELELIQYLNDNFDNVILVVNANNVMELGWVKNYPNVRSVLWAPGGGDQAAAALADVFTGAVTPSGHLVDTMAYDNFSSPAMANMGDIRYTNKGKDTAYYGYSYDEGIYVGYKYYETRYYDAVMKQGNAGEYDYASTVQYPFGYGASYTDFAWSNYKLTSNNDGTLTVSVDVENVGEAKGKDVVQVYVNAPYTTYDKTNYVEKAAASLVGFAKTKTLEKGGKETVKITVKISDLTSYDDYNAKTYILEDGDYLLTAAQDAHTAVNNFLDYAGKSASDGMVGSGDKSFVDKWNNPTFDKTTYAVSACGETITNRFDGKPEEGGSNYIERKNYLSRRDWVGTWPITHGNQNDKTASTMSEVNGYQYKEEISDALLAKLEQKGTAEAANNPVSDSEITAEMAGKFGVAGEEELITYRGIAFDEIDWSKIVSQMLKDEVAKIISLSGYETPAAESIQKPQAVDLDGPAGLNGMVGMTSYSIAYPAEVLLAASWNIDNLRKMGQFVGEDGLVGGFANGWYAPAMNIHRTPFAGRNFEYYSEDAYLSGTMATSAVVGAAERGMYSFVKHFALNDQENHRQDNGPATFCNEQAMREIYLRPFQMVAETSGNVTVKYNELDTESGAFVMKETQLPAFRAVMTSYNRIGATWAGGSYNLITEILRGEWGFDGFVLTDYSTGASGFMHEDQMLRAGADAQLTQYGMTINLDTPADIYYAKQAMEHILYTVVNSTAMNGLVLGATIPPAPFPNYYVLVWAVDALCALGIVICGILTVRKFVQEKKGAKAKKR